MRLVGIEADRDDAVDRSDAVVQAVEEVHIESGHATVEKVAIRCSTAGSGSVLVPSARQRTSSGVPRYTEPFQIL